MNDGKLTVELKGMPERFSSDEKKIYILPLKLMLEPEETLAIILVEKFVIQDAIPFCESLWSAFLI